MIGTETMKSKHVKLIGPLASTVLLTVFVACGLANPPVLQAQEAAKPATPAGAIRYDARPGGNTMKIEGTSTLHDWAMVSGLISGFVESDANFPESALSDSKAAKPTVQAFIPVKSFKSVPSEKKMDSGMYDYLKEP